MMYGKPSLSIVLRKSFSSFLVSRQKDRNQEGDLESLNISKVDKYTMPSRISHTLRAYRSSREPLVASRAWAGADLQGGPYGPWHTLKNRLDSCKKFLHIFKSVSSCIYSFEFSQNQENKIGDSVLMIVLSH